MGPGPAWSVSPIEDAAAFFRALPDLMPDGSVLYLEDVCSQDGVDLASRHAVEPPLNISLGTIWPRPSCFHVPFSRDVAEEFAQFAEHHATPEIAIHLHAYQTDEVLLEWHDAFGAPLRLATTLPEVNVRRFCERLHCTYAIETA